MRSASAVCGGMPALATLRAQLTFARNAVDCTAHLKDDQ